MKFSLLISFVLAICNAESLGFGGLFPRDNHPVESPVEAQDTIIDNPDIEPATDVPQPTETTDSVTQTIVYPPSETTVDAQGTTIYYCIPSPTETSTIDAQEVTTTAWYWNNPFWSQGETTSSVDAQATWPAATSVVDGKTLYYCPPKTTDIVVNEVSSTIYYSKPTTTVETTTETTTTTDPGVIVQQTHVCELTSTVNVRTTDTCEYSVETIKMDVFKTIYVSSCVATDEVVVIEQTSTTDTVETTTTTTEDVQPTKVYYP